MDRKRIFRRGQWMLAAGYLTLTAACYPAAGQNRSDMRTVRPKETQQVLTNPGIGFTTFQRFNGDALNAGDNWPEGFPIQYDELKARGSAQRAFPDTSIAYFRIYWRFIEPEEGQYKWEIIDRALAYAHAHGQTLMLRVPPYGPHVEDSDVPAWYRVKYGEALPANGAKPDWQRKEPKWLVNPENPGYARDYGRLIRALGERYDGNPDLELVDIALVGAWGEGASSELLSEPTRHALVDAYMESFHRTPLDVQPQDSRSVGYTLSLARTGQARGDQSSRPLVGWRADCLGDMRPGYAHMYDYYPEKLVKLNLTDLWKSAPVSMESCWVMQTWEDRKWDIDYILDKAIQWHVSSFNNKSSAVPADLWPKVNAFLNRMGYRFVLTRFAYTPSIDASRKLQFNALINNKGNAPIYRPYNFALHIHGNGFEKVLLTHAPVQQWMPGDSFYEDAVFLPRELPDGVYAVDVAIVDPDSHQPKVKMAIEGISADGWYPMGELTLHAQDGQ